MRALWMRVLQTVLGLAAIFCAGFNEGGLGATLPDLAFLTSSPPARLASLYTWRSVASLAGSLLAGLLIDVLGGPVVLGTCLLAQGALALLTPWCRQLITLSFVNALSAFFTNGIIVGSCALSFLLWDSELSASIIQATRLTFVVGLALAPVAITGFLGVTVQSSEANSTAEQDNNSTALTAPNCRQIENGSTACTDVYLAYSTFGFMDISLALFAFAVACVVKYAGKQGYVSLDDSNKESSALEDHEENITDSNSGQTPFWEQFKTLEITLPLLFILLGMILFGCIEMVMNGLLVTFAEVYLSWSVQQSVLLLTVYQTTKLVTSVPLICIAKIVKPFKILLVDVVLITVSAILFLSVITYSDVIVWVCTVVIALGASNIFATVLSYTQEILTVCGKITGGFNVSFAIGGMILPILCGYLLENYGLMSFPAVLTGCSILLVAAVLVSKILINWFSVQSRNGHIENETSPLL